MSIECLSPGASHLTHLESNIPTNYVKDNCLIDRNIVPITPYTNAFFPQNDDILFVKILKIALIVMTGFILIPMIILLADQAYYEAHHEDLKDGLITPVDVDMERMDIRLGGERITDVHELYQNILESHHGDEKEALRMMCFLHQGVMAGFLKEVFLHYAEGDLSTSQYMLLQRNHQDPYDVEEGGAHH